MNNFLIKHTTDTNILLLVPLDHRNIFQAQGTNWTKHMGCREHTVSLPSGLVMETNITGNCLQKCEQMFGPAGKVSGTLANHYDSLSIQNSVGVIHSQLENSFYSLHLTSFRSAPSVVDEASEIGANL
jgi:hypothetical protein